MKTKSINNVKENKVKPLFSNWTSDSMAQPFQGVQSPSAKSNNGNATENVTPESEFEGFHNYTAAEVFIQGLAGLVNQGDVETMIRAQKQM